MIINQIACINMAMPRPSGKARKIAEETIPGLNRNAHVKTKSRRKVPNDEVELKIVEINQNRGRLPGNRSNGGPSFQ